MLVLMFGWGTVEEMFMEENTYGIIHHRMSFGLGGMIIIAR